MNPPVLTYNPHPSRPDQQLPPLACDSHVHVFGPAECFAYASSRNFTPVDAPKERLFDLHRHLGIGRCVIVQSAVHGMDNRVVEDAIAAGQGRYLGVALAPLDVGDSELQRLAGVGFRALRFNFMPHLGGAVDTQALLALTQRLAPLQMHLQVHFPSAMVHTLAPVLAQSAVPVVIDHMGRVDAQLGPAHADFVALCELLGQPGMHVKVSGIDRIDPSPPYQAGLQLARNLIERFPTQCVWGTDWPHPNHTHVPDDGALVNAIWQMAPDAALRQQVLVDNPQALYRFADH
jgi:2-pyrone-4,6-dicarboxylate lactonase